MGSSHSSHLSAAPHLPIVFPNPMQKSPKEPIPEEQELDFQGLEEEEEEPPEGLDQEGPESGTPGGGAGMKPEGSLSWTLAVRPPCLETRGQPVLTDVGRNPETTGLGLKGSVSSENQASLK